MKRPHPISMPKLMRSLGFTRLPFDPKRHILPPKQATYWAHQPSSVWIMTLNGESRTPEQIVRSLVHAAIYQTLKQVEEKVTQPIHQMRRDNESRSVPSS